MTEPVSGNGSPVGSVDRALTVIELLSESGSGVSLEDLARASGIPKSSLHRTLAALKFRGFAVQHVENGSYFLGTRMLSAAFAFYERLDLRALVHPLLVRLRDEFNETIHMAVLDGAEVVYLDKTECSHPIKMTSVIGGRNPAHCTGVGKALLAFTYPTDESMQLWVSRHEPLAPRTPATITNGTKLAREMTRIRERGYALDREESEAGVRCVAVPLFLGGVSPAAAVSVTAPRERLSAARLSTIAQPLKQIVSRWLSPDGAATRGAARSTQVAQALPRI